MNTYQPCASVSQLPAALRLPQKKRAPGFLNTYIVNLVDFHGFEVPLDFFSKSGQSSQMTMPARRASKFCAKRRALSPELFLQSLIPRAIPGFCEPWSECKPGVCDFLFVMFGFKSDRIRFRRLFIVFCFHVF